MDDNNIQYIEFQATDLERMKGFYSSVFGWTFTDYGDDYTAFEDSGVSGGFAKAESVTRGGPLVVLYHKELELARENIINGGGEISKDIFSFPGGRRFHFTDPSNNELAVWSDK
jgi:predicted enzyme related to lactoylglutathione lyase